MIESFKSSQGYKKTVTYKGTPTIKLSGDFSAETIGLERLELHSQNIEK